MADKPVKVQVKLQIPAGKANPAPPIGPALGQHGIATQEFCQKFNDATKDRMGEIVPVVITIYEDRSFDFITKTAPASDLIKRTAGVKKGSGEPNKKKVGKLTWEQCMDIAEAKLEDINAYNKEHGGYLVAGTARSMGITVEGVPARQDQ